jgi:hypothetical protein
MKLVLSMTETRIDGSSRSVDVLEIVVEVILAISRPWASVLHGCAGWRKGRPVSMLRILPSCRTNTMLTVATTFRGRSDA